MSQRSIWTLVIAVFGVASAWSSVYVVDETELVLITQFGKIMRGPGIKAGLHFKKPFVEDVLYFDKRWMEWDGAPNQIPTRDKKYIWVDAYSRWRISDPVRFYKRLRNEEGAQSRLDDIIDGELRNVIANHHLIEIVRASSRPFEETDDADEGQIDNSEFGVKKGRDRLMADVLRKSSDVMPEYGIELADVQIKRINYEESVQSKVFQRMISERHRIAARYRSEGEGKSAEIMGRVDKELKIIQSEAYRKAAEIRGKADAEAASIYAAAYNRNPKFYQFMKTLESYPALIGPDTQLILSTQSEVFKIIKTP